jgi:hypothetical protein
LTSHQLCSGVGDLFTDPQIHTIDGDGYGRGNMGVRGIALFFASHRCATGSPMILISFQTDAIKFFASHRCATRMR